MVKDLTLDKPDTPVPPYAWVVLVVVYLASVAAPLNQFKVPPLLPVLMDVFALSLAQAASLMSVFAITGLLLALPAGLILQRLGPRLSGTIALGCLAAGSAMGALASSLGPLLTSRVIEGVGMGLLGVVAPASIAMWFPPERRGAPMGIWATWVPVGSIVSYFLGPALATGSGWQSVWWLGAAFAVVVLIGYALLMRSPSTPSVPVSGHQPQIAGLRHAFANRNLWLVALAFACFNLVMISLGTFFPTFLVEVRGYPLAQASRIASLSTVMVLFSAPLAGWLSDRIGSLRLILALPFLGIGALIVLPFLAQGWLIPAVMIAMGFVVGAIPTATFAATPEVMLDPRAVGLGLSVMMLAQNVGNLVGPGLYAELINRAGWVVAAAWLIPFCLLGFLAGWMVKIR